MRGLIAYGVRNPVFANLLMLCLIVGGYWSARNMVRERFPEFSIDRVSVDVAYPGAAPADVETDICTPIENVIAGIEGIRETSSFASQDRGQVVVWLKDDARPATVLDDVRKAVDQIDTFPPQAERPVIREMTVRLSVISVAVSGDADERTLKQIAQDARDDLLAMPEISQVSLWGTRDDEIAIEVSEEALRTYGLTLDDIMAVVSRSSLDVPAGQIRTADEELILRVTGRRLTAAEFEDLVIIAGPDGAQVRLGQIAEVRDAFEDVPAGAWFNGQPAAVAAVFKTPTEDAIRIARRVRAYVRDRAGGGALPPGLRMTVWDDRTVDIENRIAMLISNGVSGLVLVLISLALFLNVRLAFWVMMGVPMAFGGAFIIMHSANITLNMITLFALIMVSGMDVDDAIVIGEAIHARRRRGEPPAEAAINGAYEVALPVLGSSLTTIIAFVPLLFVVGIMGKFIEIAPVVVIAALTASAVEAFLVLPCHLAGSGMSRASYRATTVRECSLPSHDRQGVLLEPSHDRQGVLEERHEGTKARSHEGEGLGIGDQGSGNESDHNRQGVLPSFVFLARLKHSLTVVARLSRAWLDRHIDGFVDRRYRPACDWVLRHRGLSLAAAVGLLLGAAGLVLGGRTPLYLLQSDDVNMLRARLRFPDGTPAAVTRQAVRRVEEAARRLNRHDGLDPSASGEIVRNVYSAIGAWNDFLPQRGANLCEVRVELTDAGRRRVRDEDVLRVWRDEVGTIPDAVVVSIGRDQIAPTDLPIEIRLTGDNLEDLQQAAGRIETELARFEGVLEVYHDLVPGPRELRVSLRPEARGLGLTLQDVATQVRQGFFGGRAVRVQRGRDEVWVRVRYPDEQRRSVFDLENMRIRTPAGHPVPFAEVAELAWTRGFATIAHRNGRRWVSVFAELDERRANADEIINALTPGFLPRVAAGFEGLSFEIAGQRELVIESLESLANGFWLAMLFMYAILATVLRSYLQPLVIMSAIPFGLVGAVVGHLVMGYDLTMMSLFGLVALSGIVVNNTLVLMDHINARLKAGAGVAEAAATAGAARFRAVVLTSLTTVLGLAPLMFNTSGQVRTLIPMAISLSFGLTFTTVLTLLLVPALFLLLNDAKRIARWLRCGGAFPSPEAVERIG